MSGSDLTNQIISILVRFRENFVAVTADIEAMFYQVFVTDQHESTKLSLVEKWKHQ